MLYEVSPEGSEPAAFEAAYAAKLDRVLGERGVATIADTTGVDESTLDALADGSVDDATLADAAAVLAVDADAGPDAIAAEVRDHLLMEMSTAILDVDTISVEIDYDLTGQEVQQALEGRIRLKLDELAAIHALIERRKRR